VSSNRTGFGQIGPSGFSRGACSYRYCPISLPERRQDRPLSEWATIRPELPWALTEQPKTDGVPVKPGENYAASATACGLDRYELADLTAPVGHDRTLHTIRRLISILLDSSPVKNRTPVSAICAYSRSVQTLDIRPHLSWALLLSNTCPISWAMA
jgi:hypothetical protein